MEVEDEDEEDDEDELFWLGAESSDSRVGACGEGADGTEGEMVTAGSSADRFKPDVLVDAAWAPGEPARAPSMSSLTVSSFCASCTLVLPLHSPTIITISTIKYIIK